MPQVSFLHPTQISGIGKRYVYHSGPFVIDEPDLNRIFPGISGVQVEPYNPEHIKGDADPQNLQLVCKIASHQTPKRVLELSTFRGKTAYNLALFSPEDASVLTADLPIEDLTGHERIPGTDFVYFQPKERIGSFYKGTPLEPKIKQIYADCTTPKAGELVDELLEGEKIDLAFIDIGHAYDTTKAAFEGVALPRMKEGGVVIFDDYFRQLHPGITHYLTRKAYEDGFVFYAYMPMPPKEPTQCALFLNVPEAIGYNWREVREVKQ